MLYQANGVWLVCGKHEHSSLYVLCPVCILYLTLCIVRPCIYCADKVGFISFQAALDALIRAACSDIQSHSESYSVLKGMNEFLSKSSPHFLSSLGKVWYEICI